MISEKALTELRKAGWFEGRKIDTELIEDHLKKLGYTIFPAVREFLMEFGMLELSIKIDDPHVLEVCNSTNTIKSIDKLSRNRMFNQLELFIKEKLVPVGEVYNKHQWLSFLKVEKFIVIV